MQRLASQAPDCRIVSRLLLAVLASAGLTLSACGGSSSSPETPADETEASSATGDEGETSSTEPTEKSDPEPEPAAEPEPKKEAAANPRDTLIREGTAFMLNFEKSDPGAEEKKKCEKNSGGDVAKEANCFSSAMNKIPREGVLFEKKGDDWWYVRFGLIKNARVDFNKVKVDIGEPSGKKLTLTPNGPDKAARRKGTVPKELVFTVVDEYTVELDDPTRGKLIFEPKLGLFSSE